jgi:hypothetical protein
MNLNDVNAAEAAIYSLSAAGLLLLIVAALFVWGSQPRPPAPEHPHQTPAE